MPEDLRQRIDAPTTAQIVDRKPMAQVMKSERPYPGAFYEYPKTRRHISIAIAFIVPENIGRSDERNCADNCADSTIVEWNRTWLSRLSVHELHAVVADLISPQASRLFLSHPAVLGELNELSEVAGRRGGHHLDVCIGGENDRITPLSHNTAVPNSSGIVRPPAVCGTPA